MTTKRSVGTAHGEIDYTTVTCDSCGTEILHDDARRFVIGELRDRRDLSASGLTRVDFTQETVATGWACPYCRERESEHEAASGTNVLGVPSAQGLTLREQFYRIDLNRFMAYLILLWVCTAVSVELLL